MSQVKIFGVREKLVPVRELLSNTIHACVMEALGLPEDKRAHRFFPLDREDFFMPGGRTEAYTIIEISMIQGRTTETKKKLIRLLFDNILVALRLGDLRPERYDEDHCFECGR